MRSKAAVLEGTIEVSAEDDLGHYEIYIAGQSVAEWATKIVPYDESERKVKAVLMIEDQVCVEAQGWLTSEEGEYGYSSMTPGHGPMVWVFDGETIHEIADKLRQNSGCNAALSLEAAA